MRCAFLIVYLALLSPIGFSVDIYVPDDYGTIQGAIKAAVDGDTVIVRPGTYVENVDFVGKAITVKSEHGPDVTTLDGNRSGSVVSFKTSEGELAVLDGFTITNGSGTPEFGGDYGGGIYCKKSSPTIINNEIRNNKIEWDGCGGGIYCEESSPAIAKNIITLNSIYWSGYGGGIFCAINSNALVANNEITDNKTVEGGGGIACFESSAAIYRNQICSNRAEYNGGGIYCDLYSDAVIEQNTISMNEASWDDGGGICCFGFSNAIIECNIVSENRACAGGGISCRGSSTEIRKNIITMNVAENPWGSLGTGGGIYYIYWNGPSRSIGNNLILGNKATTNGGGISCEGSLTVVNNSICGNRAGNKGGGMRCSNSTVIVVNSILWNNDAPEGKEIALGSSSSNSTLDISYSDVKGGQSSVVVEPGCTLNWGFGIIDADPLFLDPANDDYHITFDSPCRSAGDRNAPDLPDTDFESDPRTGLFAFPDVGADEFHTHFYVNGTVSNGSTATGIIIGWPKANPVMLISGSGVLPTPHPTPFGGFWLMPPWDHRVHFDPMPDNGVRIIERILSTGLPPGTQIPFQALVGTELSNLWIVAVE